MSTSAARAYRELIDAGDVAEAGELEPYGKLGDVAFVCTLPIPYPNGEGLPATTRMRVRIPAQFPRSKVEFLPIDPSLRGFAHQDGRTGAPCLKPEKYPREPSARLRAYVESVKEWLADAARGTLLEAGQRWELPDFRTDRTDEPPRVLSLEDASTFQTWKGRVGQSGEVQLAAHVHDCGLVPVRFSRASETILEPRLSEGFLNRASTVLAPWLLLPSLIVERHRPARTFRELETQCAAAGIDLWQALRRAIKHQPYRGYYYLLVGAAIPDKVRDPVIRIHWQPIAIAEASVRSMRGVGKKQRSKPHGEEHALRSRLRGAWLDQTVPWGDATAYPTERAAARGSLSEPVKAARVCVLGCGALGSLVAEHLARGGSRELALFDNEVLELENLSRHSLSPLEVGRNKAVALAHRLNGIHPSAHVRGFPVFLPPTPPTNEHRLSWDLLQRADVLIDCTANEMVFHWASEFGRECGKRVLHLFMNAHARMLTLCHSGRHASCARVLRRLLDDVQEGRTGFSVEEYDPFVPDIPADAACWYVTVPALGSNIAAIVAAAVPVIDELVARSRPSSGAGIVFRRREVELGQLAPGVPATVIEVAWAADYR